MSNVKYDEFSGFNKYPHIDDVFTDASNDTCSHSLVELSKPPKFDDSPFKCWETCWKFEVLQLPLMAMTGSHSHENTSKHNQIWFPSQDSSLGEYSSSNILQTFQLDHFEFHDRIVDWLEESYLSLAARKKFWLYLELCLYENANKCTFTKHC